VAAGKYDITLERGETFRRRFAYERLDGQPIVLTGYSARLRVVTDDTARAELMALTEGNGGIILYGSSGEVETYISLSGVEDLPFTQARYYLELIAPNGDVERILEGTIRRNP